jgi:iron-sulfur cluster repair protein YtfE (RIC family)
VYTQTSDVEIEVNGLLTYDREVVKMDLHPHCCGGQQTLSAAADRD